MNTIVFDLETQNTFDEAGGQEKLDKLGVSAVGVYLYTKNEYICYTDKDKSELLKLFGEKCILIGFSSTKLDIPLLSYFLDIDIFPYPRIDISDEIEIRTGRLIKLDDLAKLNLGISKTGKAIDAPRLYKEGKIEELKEYCLQDVKITKELYEKIKSDGSILIPSRDSEKISERVEINLSRQAVVW